MKPVQPPGAKKTMPINHKYFQPARIAVSMCALADAYGGFTYQVREGEYLQPGAPGFVASPFKARELQIPLDSLGCALQLERVLKHYQSNLAFASEFGASIGGWVEEKKGGMSVLFLDVCVVFRDISSALECARQHEQIAIWDNARRELIPVG
jgi:hypothetical protein